MSFYFQDLLKTPPYDHQVEAYERSKDAPAFALHMEPSTGKSYVILLTATHLYLTGKIKGLLIIAPNGVHRQWVEEEIAANMPHIPHAAAWYSSKQGKNARKQVDALPEQNGLVILVMNIGAISHTSGYNYAAQFVSRCGTAMVTFDESQKIKSPSAVTTANMWRLRSFMKASKGRLKGMGEHTLYRRTMSGKAVVKGIEDLYAPFRFLDPAIIDCQTYAEFKAMFCNEVGDGYGHNVIVGYRNVKLLRQRLAPYVFAKKKIECQDLPPQTWARQYIELSEEQRKAYNELRHDYQTELRTGQWVTAHLAVTRLRRLQQVVAGHLTDPASLPGERKVIALDCPRVDACVELVQEFEGKVIIWAEEHFEIERLEMALKKAGVSALTYYGGIKEDLRAANLAAFKTVDDVKVLVANTVCGGVGLNIAVAPNAIFYSHTWSAGDRFQAENRNHRPGIEQYATTKVTYTDLICKGTVDERIRRRVNKKDEVGEMIEHLDRELLEELLADDEEDEKPLVIGT